MARAHYRDSVQAIYPNRRGQAIQGASIRVTDSTSGALLTLYSEATGASTSSNPLTSDAYGEFKFYLLSPGLVNLTISGVGLAARTVPAYVSSPDVLSGPRFDIRRYGADMTGATASDTALDDAWDAVQSASLGGVLYIPDGTLLLAATHTLTAAAGKRVAIIGEGRSSVIRPAAGLAGTSTPLIEIDGAFGSYASHILRDFTFNCGTIGGGWSVNVPALKLTKFGMQGVVENVHCYSVRSTYPAILCETVLLTVFRDCLIRSWYGKTGQDAIDYPAIGAGIRFQPGSVALGIPTNTIFDNCELTDWQRGIDFAYPSPAALSNPNVITIDRCRLDQNRYGVYADRLRIGELSILRSRFETDHGETDPAAPNAMCGIAIFGYPTGENSDYYAHNVTIRGNKFSQFGTDDSTAIQLNRVKGVLIERNSITGDFNSPNFLDIDDGGYVTEMELRGNQRHSSPNVLLTIKGWTAKACPINRWDVDQKSGGIQQVPSVQGWVYDSIHEVQTATVSGSPTGGHYHLTHDGNTTGEIAYNAAAADVQTALRLLTGLGSVTVTATGTTPNFIHTVTFIGVSGDTPEMTSDVTGLTGGSSPAVTIATTTAGSLTSQNPSLGTKPAYTRTRDGYVEVAEAFNSTGTNEITVGHSTDTDAYITAVDVSTTGIKTVTLGSGIGYDATERAVEAYFVTNSTGATTAGKALVVLNYERVNAAPA